MPGAKTVFRFAVFEADAESGELRKSGVRMRIPDQAFQVLTALLERPGEVISREQLKQKLWAEDTFVDFDHSLNAIINKLRDALGDTAASPRYIETLARRGYRFLPPVQAFEKSADVPPVPALPQDLIASNSPSVSRSFLTSPGELPAGHRRHAHLLFLLIQVMYVTFYVVALARLQQLDAAIGQTFGRISWVAALTLISALVGVPLRLYLISAVGFGIGSFSQKFRRLFPVIFVLDELWALSPLLLAGRIGIGLALAATAALVYVPFSERSLVFMADRATTD